MRKAIFVGCGAAAALVAALAITPAHAAERAWVAVGTPHFSVVSNAGEGTAREIAWQFEQIRSVFKVVWPWGRVQSGRPFVVFVARDESSLRALAPQYWEDRGFRPAAVYVGGMDKDYVALRTDVDRRDSLDLNPYATAYEGYANVVLAATFPRDAPLWFSRGLEELIGNTLVRQKDVQVGRLIPYHLQRLVQGSHMPLSQLLEISRQSPEHRNESARRLFDAQSWALVHYLAFGDKQAHKAKLNLLATLILAGREPKAAMEEALGDLGAIERGFRLYLTNRLFMFSQTLPQVHEVEGLLLDAEGKRDEARAAFASAIALGSEDYYTYYRHASLAWPSGRGEAEFAPIARDLEMAARLSPDFADAHAWLAHARVETRALPAAVEAARRAVALEPSRSGHHRALARALGNSGQHAEALQAVQRAIALAANEEERTDAQELLEWIRGAAASR